MVMGNDYSVVMKNFSKEYYTIEGDPDPPTVSNITMY
jgi:hypothetical protein